MVRFLLPHSGDDSISTITVMARLDIIKVKSVIVPVFPFFVFMK